MELYRNYARTNFTGIFMTITKIRTFYCKITGRANALFFLLTSSSSLIHLATVAAISWGFLE